MGWQREVSMKVEQHFEDSRLMPTMNKNELLRSQGGPLAAALFTCPTDSLPQCFRVSLHRLFASHSFCHNSPAGVAVHTRHFWPPRCRLCSGRGVGSAGFCDPERGGPNLPGRRCPSDCQHVSSATWIFRISTGWTGDVLEVVAGGLPFFGKRNLLLMFFVSALKRDWTTRAKAATKDGEASMRRRRKDRIYPELSGEDGRCRLFVLGGEVAKDGHPRDSQVPDRSARAKSRDAPEVLWKSAQIAW